MRWLASLFVLIALIIHVLLAATYWFGGQMVRALPTTDFGYGPLRPTAGAAVPQTGLAPTPSEPAPRIPLKTSALWLGVVVLIQLFGTVLLWVKRARWFSALALVATVLLLGLHLGLAERQTVAIIAFGCTVVGAGVALVAARRGGSRAGRAGAASHDPGDVT